MGWGSVGTRRGRKEAKGAKGLRGRSGLRMEEVGYGEREVGWNAKGAKGRERVEGEE